MDRVAPINGHGSTARHVQLLLDSSFDAIDIEHRFRKIHEHMLSESRYIRAANFTSIAPEDLRLLFERYDAEFFASGLTAMLKDLSETPLAFRLSRRMTSSAGTTESWRNHSPARESGKPWSRLEIAISTTLLYTTFRDESSCVVAGLECRDRLEALQRVFEHELIHLAETLAFGASTCGGEIFAGLARRIFGHTHAKHRLITPREAAATRNNIHVGQFVRFDFEGKAYSGFVRRITKRATVLVPDPAGEPYTDGFRYRKFYVPAHMLQPANVHD
jgi:hypothetical protein